MTETTVLEQKLLTKYLKDYVNQPEKLQDLLDTVFPAVRRPAISTFKPRAGRPGDMLVIDGKNLTSVREMCQVTVGGKPAVVVEATRNRLKVITDKATATGPVKVSIGVHRAVSGPYDFRVLPYPTGEEDGPPITYTGKGTGMESGAPPTGALHVLVVTVNPTDRIPANPNTTRNAVINAWANVHTYYDQASYNRLNVDVTVTGNWHTLTGSFNDYYAASEHNIAKAVLDRLMAEAAQAAVDEGFNLDDYEVMACVINLDNTPIRAWGNFSQSQFNYNDNAGTNINITTNHTLYLLAINETPNWGRIAHELGHDIVDLPAGLSAPLTALINIEDVYGSDLADPAAATATMFDIMGSHDTHPLFSAYYLESMGYYQPVNIMNLQWDRNAFSQEYDVVAHGLAENTLGGRYHAIKIRVTDGLYYYVEVRQRPGTSGQVFDTNIPVAGSPNDGGVVVTKVFTDLVNMNQQMRFITLLHDPHVLESNEIAVDPARALKITVENMMAGYPLVCRVKVEWAQAIADDPAGKFDLRI